MNRGEIRWYKFTLPDKKRPVLILSRDSIIEFLSEVTIAPITRKIRDIPSEVILTRQEGMPMDCAINLDHIQTVSKAKLGSFIASLNFEKMKEVAEAIRFALDL